MPHGPVQEDPLFASCVPFTLPPQNGLHQGENNDYEQSYLSIVPFIYTGLMLNIHTSVHIFVKICFIWICLCHLFLHIVFKKKEIQTSNRPVATPDEKGLLFPGESVS